MTLEVLTHTKRRDFKNCSRYYLHRHVQHLSPRIQKRGRRKGSIFGDMIFAVNDTNTRLSPGLLNEDETLWEFICTGVENAYDALRDSGLPAEILEELDVEEVKMKIMVYAYVKKYGVDTRREIEFSIPFRNPRTGATSRAFKLGGKIDGVHITGHHEVEIIEDKLVGQIQKVMIDRLPLDDQVTSYVDAFIQMGWDAKVAYRHTRWPQTEPGKEKIPPALTPGGKPSKAKHVPAETMDEFCNRLLEDVMETRPEFYFDEQHLWFPKDHLDDFRRGRWGTAQQILQAKRVWRMTQGKGSIVEEAMKPLLYEAFPMNPSRCWEYGGCEFIPLCTKQNGAEALYETVLDNQELTQGQEDGTVTSEYGPTA